MNSETDARRELAWLLWVHSRGLTLRSEKQASEITCAEFERDLPIWTSVVNRLLMIEATSIRELKTRCDQLTTEGRDAIPIAEVRKVIDEVERRVRDDGV